MNARTIFLSDPDVTELEQEAIQSVFAGTCISCGPIVEQFEAAFAAYLGRKHAIAVSGGTIGLLIILKAVGAEAGKEVIVPSFSFRETAHAVTLAGFTPRFVDVDYWSGTVAAEKVERAIGGKTCAIVAANANGHPAPWGPLRNLSRRHELPLIEDSTEAIGSTYQDRPVGTFGDCSLFDFSQPSPLVCGQGGMIVTDQDDIATRLRWLRSRRIDERKSVVRGATVPYDATMSDLSAALGLAQLKRLDQILAKRKRIEALYFKHVKSFEGIKDPYRGPDVTEVHWLLYVVHMGTRFSRSSRDAIVEDLKTEKIEAAAYCHPLHAQPYYVDLGSHRGDLPITEKIADRAVALPFHSHINEEQIAFIVSTMKDASINVGAGSAIYL